MYDVESVQEIYKILSDEIKVMCVLNNEKQN